MKVLHSLERLAAVLLLSGVATTAASAMSFQPAYVDGHPGIIAVGQITMDTPSEFASVPVAPGTQVYLNSPGGNVGAAVSLGNLFRSRGVTAVVAGVTQSGVSMPGGCYSACVYALVGASRRVVPGGSRVGIHRMQAATEDLTGSYERAEHRAAASTLMGYTARMGVDPSMIASAERTPSASIHVLSARELRRWGVANSRY